MKKIFECEKCGKSFDDEKICKKHELTCNIGELVYVAECFFVAQTFHENPRFYSMFKETIIVSDEFVGAFRKVSNNYEYINDLMYSDIVNELPDEFTKCLIEDFIMCGEFDEKSISNIIDNKKFTDYYGSEYYPNDDLVCEIHFVNPYKSDDEIGNAFVSVYKIEKEKLSKHDKINVNTRKWITDNISR